MGLIGRPVDSLIPPVGTASGGVQNRTAQDMERPAHTDFGQLAARSSLSTATVSDTQEERGREKNKILECRIRKVLV